MLAGECQNLRDEVPRAQALELCSLYTRIGIDPEAMQAGQEAFGSKKRIEWRLR